MSLDAIRALLDKPVKTAMATPATEDQAAAKVLVLPGPAESTKPASISGMEVIRPVALPGAPVPAPALPRPSSSLVDKLGGQKNLLLGVVVVALLALILGLRLMHKSAPAAPPAVVQHSSTTAAPVTPKASPRPALAPREGSVAHQVMPAVTAQAQRTIQGTVKVKVQVGVDAEGRVWRAKLANRGSSSYFAKQALEAARQWAFTAPVRGGTPQSSEWTIQFAFRRSGTEASARRISRN